jgi:hypothetical protein
MLNEKSNTAFAFTMKIFSYIFIIFTKFVYVSVSIFDKMKEFIGVDFDFNLGTVYAQVNHHHLFLHTKTISIEQNRVIYYKVSLIFLVPGVFIFH